MLHEHLNDALDKLQSVSKEITSTSTRLTQLTEYENAVQKRLQEKERLVQSILTTEQKIKDLIEEAQVHLSTLNHEANTAKQDFHKWQEDKNNALNKIQSLEQKLQQEQERLEQKTKVAFRKSKSEFELLGKTFRELKETQNVQKIEYLSEINQLNSSIVEQAAQLNGLQKNISELEALCASLQLTMKIGFGLCVVAFVILFGLEAFVK